ncbi:LysR family transcriptional regulator [Eubacteriaceae bacterium ES2]|nr:LysR family transcriptional regulator [Eubacteriaceae bacterium ES2]
MEIFQLKVFASVAKTLNFSKTAEQFFVTQPAVSHQIKMLERDLGVALLKRSGHGVWLTPEGTEMLNYALQIIELANKAESRMKNVSEGRSGYLRIVTLPICRNELSECLKLFSIRNPGVQVDIELLEGKELIQKALEKEADFYFATDEMCDAAAIGNYHIIREECLYLFVNAEDTRFFDMNDWSTLKDHPFISIYQTDTILYNKINAICHKRGLIPNIVSYFNRADSALISVNAGVGKAIFPPDYLQMTENLKIKTYPIHGDDALMNYVVGWDSNNLSLAARNFLSIINELYGEMV